MMPNGGPTYCFDTSSLVHAWQRAYPLKRFPSVWTALDGLIEDGRMIASIEVLHELKRKDDDLFAWAKDRKEAVFREIDDDVQSTMLWIMSAYPRLVDTKTGKSGGDPFVLAQALTASPFLVVVTEEQGGSEKSPKIPWVCAQQGIRHLNLLQLIEEEDWSFG